MVAVYERSYQNATKVTRKANPFGFDPIFAALSKAAAITVLVLLAGIMASMIYGGWPAFREFGLGFLTGTQWDTMNDRYGGLPAIIGTLSTALIAMMIGVPLSLGTAIYLTQLAPAWFKRPVGTAVELLAAVPSIIYGMWGLFVFVPLFAAYFQVPVSQVVEGMPILGTILYARSPSGLGILSAGIILAFMIVPFIASLTRDMLDQIPTVLRESAYGIGCTTWEVVRHVLLPQAGVSIVGAIMLGLGRALGETMAVTFVIGNANRLSASIMDPGSTIASRIASEFNEALGMQMNALIGLGCVLFFVTFVVLVIARILVSRVKQY
ncbi:MAG: phosphate ABC transporter permease subunit PstC [Hyphomicrobiales bacterium]|jgi:phosphate transport system permease protein|nr:phosphate ABC transporter permease subunit PstC [Hyphomicrobiales bacterium]